MYICITLLSIFSIYPSQEQESGIHIPISNHAGSLPDLSVLQFPSPLSTPLDDEEQNFTSSGSAGSNVNLSPNLMSPTPASPPQPSVSARRNLQSSPSPLVLTNVNQMRLPLSPPVRLLPFSYRLLFQYVSKAKHFSFSIFSTYFFAAFFGVCLLYFHLVCTCQLVCYKFITKKIVANKRKHITFILL